MADDFSVGAAGPVFRVDKFVVPAGSLAEFVEQIRQVHRTLAGLPGCLQKHLLTQTSGDAEFNVVTIVQWVDADAVASAQAVIQKKFKDEKFDQASFRKKLGVRGDSGFYAEA
ncbi:MAG TPA: antibiotic biosynthesis monooxygenase [Polaromonas sp.]|uniref:antibiotic biosynthesis monooxygenase n=1 Tax=Polaromonas sp. TaxID=1869339 RepID=UPI002D4A52BB|nr:antibiotic biosynthesis monooxygenase [Polaromonas sp.]HYW58347.1 antibiotic biosynthesis monooxygenase [Polaromonas sp.]